MSKIKKLFVLILVFLPVLLGAEEGYDPLIQISHQFAKANMLIVLDISGSMNYDMGGNTVGADSTGFYPAWSSPTKIDKGNCSKYKWSITLKASGNNPSRIAIVKNALGDSVYLTEFNPATVSVDTWKSIPLNSGWNWLGLDLNNRPQWWCCSNNTPGTTPFAINESCPGYIRHAPKDLIGQAKDSVNWALVVYSANNGAVTYYYGDCSLASIQTQFDLSETGDVSALEGYFKLTTQGGLAPSGATPTKGAMTFARSYIRKSLTGGTLVDFDIPQTNDKNSWTFTQDAKFFTCDRAYGVILVTDGQSNYCNPSSGEWGNGCPNNWSNYPPGTINSLYFDTSYSLTYGGLVYKPIVKTWVIGVSDDVSPCEINFDAYMGRTDASAPKGDAGFDTSADLNRLPKMNTYIEADNQLHPGRLHYTTLKVGHELDNYDPSQNYGFFADSENSLAEAFAAIIAGVATGDYTTSSPVSSPLSTVTNSQTFLASAEFPSWKGHLYCYDTTGDIPVLLYDTGEILTSQASNERRIYTWDSSLSLVDVTTANLDPIRSIASSFDPTFNVNLITNNVIDFIRGNNGSGLSRGWKLGPVINSTPTIISSPEEYKQSQVAQELKDYHNTFEATYGSRVPLMYVGADDGLLHCFLTTDETDKNAAFVPGRELFAILPPNLIKKQVDLYNTFGSTGIATGQPKQPKDHIYGVANSPRYGDVYFGSGVWKTVMFITEGPGGDLLAALDVTDPFGKITSDPPQLPVSVLWQKNGQTIPELKNTWSMSAFGLVTPSTMKGVIGTGYDSVSNNTSPYSIVFDPTDGTIIKKNSISAQASPTPWIKNQAFADASMFQSQIHGYKDDNIADIGLQADLHGRLWFYDLSTQNLLGSIDASAKAGNSQPIYYAPAVTGYKVGNNTYDVYVFASGTPYEKDPDVTGANVGKTQGGNYFVPSIFVAVEKPWQKNAPASSKVTQIKIQDLTWKDDDGNSHNFGRRTQVTTSPLLVVPDNPTESQKLTAVIALYDPDTTDCAGTSYIIVMNFSMDENGNVTTSNSGYSAGSGAISGFAIVGRGVVVAKSGIGEGQKATPQKVKGIENIPGGGAATPISWREIQ